MKYEVQTYTLCAGWVNVWTDDDSKPVIFDSLEAAQNELQEFLTEMADAVQIGHLDDYNPEDYRIEKVAV
jgi:hypothetical protein